MTLFASIHTMPDLETFVGLCRKSPISVAAAAIYMISQLNEKEKKPLKGTSFEALECSLLHRLIWCCIFCKPSELGHKHTLGNS